MIKTRVYKAKIFSNDRVFMCYPKLVKSNEESGQGLIGAIISITILSIVFTALGTQVFWLHKEGQALSESVHSFSFGRALNLLVNDNLSCSSLVTQSPLSFNATQVGTSNPPVINLTQIPGVGGGSVFAQVGAGLVEYGNLVPSAIQLKVLSGNGNSFLGVVSIRFDGSKLIRDLSPVKTTLLILTDPSSPVSSKTITGCAGGGWVPVSYSSVSGVFVSQGPAGDSYPNLVDGCEQVTTPKTVKWCASQYSPDQQCVNAGFTTFAGACLATGRSSLGVTYPIQGALISNSSVLDGSGGRLWSYACVFGDGGSLGLLYDAPTALRCL